MIKGARGWWQLCGSYTSGCPAPTKEDLSKPVSCKRCIAKMIKKWKEGRT